MAPSSDTLGSADTPDTRKSVGVGFIAVYTLAIFSVWMAINTPATVTLALRIGTVDPDGYVHSYSLLAGLGTLVALLANPFFGRLSDRTTSRFGMRRPWMLGGLVGTAIGAVVVAAGPTIPVVLAGWLLMQASVNATIASMLAVIADYVPERQQGIMGSIAGVTVTAGLLVGTYFVQLVPENPMAQMGIPAAIALVFTLLLCVVLPDRRLDPADREPLSFKEFAGSFYLNPRTAPDLAWLILILFLFAIGPAAVATYTVYYLQDYIGIAEDRLATMTFYISLTMNGISVIVGLIAGRLADATGRRKWLLAITGICSGAGLFVMVIGASLPLFFVGSAIVGVGGGIFGGIYISSATATMHDPKTYARDLGLVNIAYTLPYSIVPFAAPLLLGIGGGTSNYLALFTVCGVVTLIGVPLLTRLKGLC